MSESTTMVRPGQRNASTDRNAPTATTEKTAVGVRMPLDAIGQPGCYVCDWSGHLLRVPLDRVRHSAAPLLNVFGHEPLFVTKISEDPELNVSEAKKIAAELKLAVSF